MFFQIVLIKTDFILSAFVKVSVEKKKKKHRSSKIKILLHEKGKGVFFEWHVWYYIVHTVFGVFFFFFKFYEYYSLLWYVTDMLSHFPLVLFWFSF